MAPAFVGSGEMRCFGRFGLFLAAGLLAGCTMLNSTAVIAPGDDPAGTRVLRVGGVDHAAGSIDAPEVGVGCRGKLGVYYLTKRVIPIRLTRKLDENGRIVAHTLFIGAEARTDTEGTPKSDLITTSDRRRGYCLDFLESATSEDIIEVDRHEVDGYLKTISSEARDQSAAIARTIIRTIFTAITMAPDFDETYTGTGLRAAGVGEGRDEEVFRAKYDPTDPVETALINQRLSQAAGFCLVLEGQAPTSIADYTPYCEDPMGYVEGRAFEPTGSARAGGEPWSAQVVKLGPKDRPGLPRYGAKTPIAEHEMDAPGIYYRPRRPFRYSILVRQTCKRDRRSPNGTCTGAQTLARGEWALRDEKTIELENVSPIIAIRVDRTFFATRKTVMQFDDGVLYDVKIRKDSELAGFVEVPLQIAKSVVAIPGNLIKVRFDNTQSRTRLVAAQMLLMQQQKDYIDVLAKHASGGGK